MENAVITVEQKVIVYTRRFYRAKSPDVTQEQLLEAIKADPIYLNEIYQYSPDYGTETLHETEEVVETAVYSGREVWNDPIWVSSEEEMR